MTQKHLHRQKLLTLKSLTINNGEMLTTMENATEAGSCKSKNKNESLHTAKVTNNN